MAAAVVYAFSVHSPFYMNYYVAEYLKSVYKSKSVALSSQKYLNAEMPNGVVPRY